MTPQQLPLDATAMLPMREAYLQSGFPEANISFEEAMRTSYLYVPMKNLAELIAEGRK